MIFSMLRSFVAFSVFLCFSSPVIAGKWFATADVLLNDKEHIPMTILGGAGCAASGKVFISHENKAVFYGSDDCGLHPSQSIIFEVHQGLGSKKVHDSVIETIDRRVDELENKTIPVPTVISSLLVVKMMALQYRNGWFVAKGDAGTDSLSDAKNYVLVYVVRAPQGADEVSLLDGFQSVEKCQTAGDVILKASKTDGKWTCVPIEK